MITSMDDALVIVRDKYETNAVWHGFELKDKYVFSLSSGKEIIKHDILFSVSVKKTTGELGLFNLKKELMLGNNEIIEAMEDIKYIDVTKEFCEAL